MKKVLLAFVVASIFAACDDSKTKTDSTTTDSTNIKIDTSATTPAVTDTTKTVDTSANKMSKDTTSKK
jgi:hypothetical protein